MNVPRRNVELKARDADPARSLSACASLGAEDHGVLKQRDTYFDAANGRLKIREQDGDRPHLIAYERPNLSGQRESRYRIVEVQNVEELKAALSDTLGVKVVVTKERRLFLWERNVRIHLDAVEGIGDFIEFEAVAQADSDLHREQAQVAKLREAFGISDADLIASSYNDLAIGRDRAVSGP